MRIVDVFVAATGNAFMRDIAEWLVEAAAERGRTASLVVDGTPPSDPSKINLVVAPHEFYVLSEFDDATLHQAMHVSVPVCTEQPGTPWFDITAIVAHRAPLAIDINEFGVSALRARGVDTRRLRLGGVPSMVAAAPQRAGGRSVDVDRAVDVVFLGGKTDRRGARLAAMAPTLWNRECDLRLFSFRRPVQPGVPGLVFGAAKYQLLANSKILLNIHREGRRPGYFEWARMIEAMANGCCIVTEPVSGGEPFVNGEHFIATDDLEGAIDDLLEHPEKMQRIGRAAQRAAIELYPLRDTLRPLLAELDQLSAVVPRPRKLPKHRRHLTVAQQLPLLPAFRANADLRARVFHAIRAEADLQRQIDAARCLLRHGSADHIERVETPAYQAANPTVTVLVTLFNYAHLVTETLDSIVASEGVDFEVTIVDDHSTDNGRDVVKAYLAAHPELPMLLLGCDANGGLANARNLAFDHARAEYVMVMDADNLVYPNAFEKLAAALDADPTAAFAYSTLEEFGVLPGVRSSMAWHVPWLCEANYIDAQAMLRKAAWKRNGGYRCDDDLVFGWEDWELWLRLADAGEHGVHVPQMLGRYRTQETSMITTTNLVADHMIRHLQDLYPNLPWS
jgi:GT2 family glycosyltransferase/glycosyltransferase involved in cell wall biosynthesis